MHFKKPDKMEYNYKIKRRSKDYVHLVDFVFVGYQYIPVSLQIGYYCILRYKSRLMKKI